ncbi:MAG TPA: putative toxin-antitoxin system toxin component, PIN family [Stellaceae bacterium]|nr:putative toxin-antitoxin system toxin component, PIN family [Stellaceae bacterium]
MVSAVFDSSVLVSAFLTRHYSGGVSNELFRFVREGKIQLHLSPDIITEALQTLTHNRRAQTNYRYTPQIAEEFCSDLYGIADIVEAPPPTPGAVPRDPDDDKIVACAVAAGVQYLVSRDHDLLSLGSYAGIAIIAPEEFLPLVRAQP